MKRINRYQEENPKTPIVAEPSASRNDINSAIDGEELLNRLRPRIKSLFE